MKAQSLDFRINSSSTLLDPDLKSAPGNVKAGFIGKRTAAVALLPEWQRIRSDAKAVKDHVLEHLDHYLLACEAAVQRNGGTVHWAASGTETTGITPCLAAVAETGSVVMASSAGTPAALNFLPENHVVVLHEAQVVNHLDDVFTLLRALSTSPRAVNFVTGPSRTADIEQTLEIGAHGPRRLHVLLLPGNPPPPAPRSGTGVTAS